mmetsp:Transcript_26881/g.48452  ORF Transcript_26881/g.48452 Transcript_26881/m.48452 type:complete len:286 (+) Transcript_26881:12-869(+)
MSCSDRDDEQYYCKYVAFPTMLVVYSAALCYTVRKLWFACVSYDIMLTSLFIVNCVFFLTRVVYWFDFIANYSNELFHFLNFWPHVMQTTAAVVLGVSWQIICRNFSTSFTVSNKCVIGLAIGMCSFANIAYILCYFLIYTFDGCTTADQFSRLYIIISMVFVGIYVWYYGMKLIGIVRLNLSDSSTDKLSRIFILAGLSFLLRILMNISLLLVGKHIFMLMEYDDGAYYAVVIIVDYTLTEVLFMCGVTYTLTSNRERPEVSYDPRSSIVIPLTCDNSTASSQS